MCICLRKPAGVIIPRDTYDQCYFSNPDGAGFAYAKDGKIISTKGYFSFDDFYEAYAPIEEEHETLVHFRIATSGMTDKDNCHPWLVEDCHKGFSFAIVHNGILSYPSSVQMSDTGHFVTEILGPQLQRDPWFLDKRAGDWFMHEGIGSSNKMIILRSDGKTYIINKTAGVDGEDGVWYSNDTFESCRWTGFGHGVRDYMSSEDRYPGYYQDATGADDYRVTTADTPKQGQLTVLPKKSGGGSNTSLPHLDRSDRKKLARLASEQFGDSGLTFQSMIRAHRELYRDTHAYTVGMTDADVDMEIVKNGFNGW